jgi:hypothetical protein
MKQPINKPVVITAVGFGRDIAPYPRRMEFEGKCYEFIDAGINFVAKAGDRITRIMTMTDGQKQFRLRSDNRGGVWTLLDITT